MRSDVVIAADDVEAFTSPKVNGKWEIINTPVVADKELCRFGVNFTSRSNNYSEIYLGTYCVLGSYAGAEKDGADAIFEDYGNIMYGGCGQNTHNKDNYYGNRVYSKTNGWVRTEGEEIAFRTIDFGTTSQQIHPDLYEWLLNNANKLVGKYRWKNTGVAGHAVMGTIPSTTVGANYKDLDNMPYSYMRFDVQSDNLSLYYNDTKVCTVNWRKDSIGKAIGENSPYSVIDFGEIPQAVPEWFAVWFRANTDRVKESTLSAPTVNPEAPSLTDFVITIDDLNGLNYNINSTNYMIEGNAAGGITYTIGG